MGAAVQASSMSTMADIRRPSAEPASVSLLIMTSSPQASLPAPAATAPPMAPINPSSSIGRKRTASLIASDDGDGQELPLLSAASSGPRSADSTAQICLCPPDMKIPRPRNAFMLYRQHLQASVVAQNPGMTNPEISKIIGRKWREEAQEVRDSWDALAEREKARHQQQYPNYKYQPRRRGKRPAALMSTDANGSPLDEWCGKCGRRSITTPATPATPFMPTIRTPVLPPLSTAMNMNPISASIGYRPPPLSMNAPMPAVPGDPRRPSIPSLGNGVLSLREQIDDDTLTPLTPPAKRRRYGPIGIPLYEPQISRRSSVQGRMDPPPPPPPRRLSIRETPEPDPSLTLPPLQTAEAKSVEAMVMTIPYVNKIKVLAKISPRLRPPGPTSRAFDVRGAVIAIDGSDAATIEKLCGWLAEELRKDEQNAVRVFRAPLVNDRSETSKGAGEGNGASCFVQYLESIASWHRRSEEMIQYITTAPARPGGASSSSSSPANNEASSSSPAPPSATQQQQQQSSPSLASSTLSSGPPRKLTPVALVPGYMLTRANLAAVRIPINDAYAPPDHWQWAATLWRGIVGPDLTIWIRECTPDEMSRSAGGGVEVREDARALIVRKEEGKDVEGRVLRRLAFEVGENVRVAGRGELEGE